MVMFGRRLTNSVGRGGANLHNDVLFVQELINQCLFSPLRTLKVDGKCGSMTIGAIESIQRNWMAVRHPDGKVSPDGPTFHFLTKGEVRVRAHTAAPKRSFPADLIRAAQSSEKKWGIPAAVTLAQWSLESNWGRSMPPNSNNPFGIKAKPGDDFVEAHTYEVIKGVKKRVVAKFKKFKSIEDAFDQHGELLATARAYANARKQEANPDGFADALTGVYATDPDYGTKLKQNMKKYNLYQYDAASQTQTMSTPDPAGTQLRLP